MTSVSAKQISEASTSVRAQFVLPGQVFAVSTPTLFTTILGSCVSVCLFDPDTKIGGLNHYLLPGMPGKYEGELSRWGAPAIENLVAKITILGANVKRLQAKVVGGAQISDRPVPAHLRVGERNLKIAIEELEKRSIPIIGKNVGGSEGRKLLFESHTGRTWVRGLAGGNT